MRKKRLVYGICLVAAVAAGLAVRARTQQDAPGRQAEWQDPTTLKARAIKEKGKGSRKVAYPAPLMERPQVDLDTALRQTLVVVAEPLSEQSVLVDPHNIETFYRLRIVETLSRGEYPECCGPADEDFPKDLAPLNQGEVYLAGMGGTVTIESVEVTVEEDFAALRPSETYLFFLSPTASGKYTVAQLGPGGTFKIKPGGGLEPLGHKQDKFRKELAQKYENSLQLLRQSLGRRGPRPD